jgi:acylphosphatase
MGGDVTSKTECRRVIFHGTVQGVGFRYSTHRIAQRFDVTGYVKNLRDGTVEAVVAGEPTAVDAFLSAVESHFSANIVQTDSEPVESPERFESFSIRH